MRNEPFAGKTILTETSMPAASSLYGQSKLRLEQVPRAIRHTAHHLTQPGHDAEAKAVSIHRLLRLADTPWPLPLGGLRNKRSLLAVRNFASALGVAVRAGRTQPR